MVIADDGSVFSDLNRVLTVVECFWNERNKDYATNSDKAERDAERVPYGDFCEAASDKGAQEFCRENSGNYPLEARCSRLAKEEGLANA